MNKQIFLFLTLIGSLLLGTYCWGQLKPGTWEGQLKLQEHLLLPFDFEIRSYRNQHFFINNDSESIKMDIILDTKDSLILAFPNFNSRLHLTKNNKKTLTGFWINFNKSKDYTVNCVIRYVSKNHAISRIKSTVFNETQTLPEKWEVSFNDGNGSTYPAIGLFHKNLSTLTGTFATETGDYRYLKGKIYKDSLILSCFDGAHAYLFLGKFIDSITIDGTFYSGKHWSTTWSGKANKNFELQDPDAITFLTDSSTFNFSSYNSDSSSFNFPSSAFNDKVTIIQLMGTWCPNCMDESRYLQELYNEYNKQGLNVIGVAYEIGNSFLNYKENIDRFKNKNNINYLITIGGKASKELASQQFYQLNKISAFPTAIILDKTGKVRSIHTGFYGPGTGIYYENYTSKMENLILDLLSE